MTTEMQTGKTGLRSHLVSVGNIKLIKKILPTWLVNFLIRVIPYKYRTPFANLSTQEVFTKIYEEGYWENSDTPEDAFNSGAGSHDPVVVETYVKALELFLGGFDKKPNVLDLGCGDFSVGSKVRRFCDHYIACDIVESLINRNKKKYQDENVEFRVLDISKNDLPDADVVFIRQVLQHLSNDLILAVLPKIAAKYKWLVLTEHLPNTQVFTPNVDIPTGPRTRHNMPSNKSGVVLTSAPFNLKPLKESCICEAMDGDSIVRTMAYQLK